MFRVLLGLTVAAWAAPALAEDQPPAIAPAAAWVKPIEPATDAAPADAKLLRVILINEQTRFTPTGEDRYRERALQIISPEALRLGTVSTDWDPSTETLIINRLRIIRDGKTIDVLASGQTFSVVHREPDLDSSVLYGKLTAFIELNDVQVGDIIDYAYTIQRHDPTFLGHSEDEFAIPSPYFRIEHAYYRTTWPAASTAKWHVTGGFDTPKVKQTADGGELVVDLKDVTAQNHAQLLTGAGMLQVSDYDRWEDVSKQFAPLYAKAETLAPDSPLKAEAAKIAAASSDPEIRAGMALALVQEKVRYVFNGINRGGYVPADADLTWKRRFGDCKGKSALLAALLHELNIPAEATLVSVGHTTQIADSQPGAHLFDHVIVRATIAGQVYWLDATHMNESDLELISLPPFKSALPITEPGTALQALAPPKPDKPLREYRIAYDASAGPDAPAPVHIERIYRGEEARSENRRYATMNDADRDKAIRLSITRAISRTVDVSKTTFSYDRAAREVHETVDGAAVMPWVADKTSGALVYSVERSAVTYTAPPSPYLNMPPVIAMPPPPAPRTGMMAPTPSSPPPIYVPPPAPIPAPLPPIVHPIPVYAIGGASWLYDRTTVTVTLPRGGAGYSVDGADIDKAAGGHQYLRTATLKDGVFTLDLVSRTTQLDTTGAEEMVARDAIKPFAGNVTIKAPVGFAPSLVETEIRAKRGAATRLEFIDRARARFDTDDYDGAFKDLGEALALKADDVEALNLRCFLEAEANRDLKNAVADCDRALVLMPNQADIFDSRGLAHYRLGQFDLALADYNAALGQNPQLPSSRFMRGVVLRRMGKASDGDVEIAAAEKLDAGVAARYERYGVKP